MYLRTLEASRSRVCSLGCRVRGLRFAVRVNLPCTSRKKKAHIEGVQLQNLGFRWADLFLRTFEVDITGFRVQGSGELTMYLRTLEAYRAGSCCSSRLGW